MNKWGTVNLGYAAKWYKRCLQLPPSADDITLQAVFGQRWLTPFLFKMQNTLCFLFWQSRVDNKRVRSCSSAVTYHSHTPPSVSVKTNSMQQWRHVFTISCEGFTLNYPENRRRSPYTRLMLGQRRRRWTSINPPFGQWLLIAGYRLLGKQEK